MTTLNIAETATAPIRAYNAFIEPAQRATKVPLTWPYNWSTLKKTIYNGVIGIPLAFVTTAAILLTPIGWAGAAAAAIGAFVSFGGRSALGNMGVFKLYT